MADVPGDLLKISIEADGIYAERNQRYRDEWRRSGWEEHLRCMKSKLKRLLNYEGGEDGLDDAIDLINYTRFFIVQAREGIRDDIGEF